MRIIGYLIICTTVIILAFKINWFFGGIVLGIILMMVGEEISEDGIIDD